MSCVIRVENLSKQYRLGVISAGTLRDDLHRWWCRMRGLPDPLARVAAMPGGPGASPEADPSAKVLWALRDVSFEVEQGEVLGVIGRNGAGKSTLLKVLSRVTAPTAGLVRVRGRIASLLEVGTGFHPDLTGRENIFLNGAILGMTRHEVRRNLDEIIAFAEVERFIDTPVKRYSSGMYVRLAFAVAAHLDPEIMIVDEVLAVGDAKFQDKCMGKMSTVAKSGRTVLFVSHNMHSIRSLCSRAILLQSGQVVRTGPAADVISQYLHPIGASTHMEFAPSPAKPHIRRIALDDRGLQEGCIRLEVDFESPYSITHPLAGIVISNSEGIPVYGSNPRFHKEGYQAGVAQRGTITCLLRDLPISSGRYYLSVWFGDLSTDYEAKLDVLAFDYHNNYREPHVPDVSRIGSLCWPCQWSFAETTHG